MPSPNPAGPCSHKTLDDHSHKAHGQRVWTCSACGKQGRWSKTWSYLGSIECRECLRASIDRVSCGCDR